MDIIIHYWGIIIVFLGAASWLGVISYRVDKHEDLHKSEDFIPKESCSRNNRYFDKIEMLRLQKIQMQLDELTRKQSQAEHRSWIRHRELLNILGKKWTLS